MCLCHCMFSFIFMPWIAFMYSISQLATLCFSSRSSSTSTTHDTFCIVHVICQASNNIHHVQDRHAGCGQEDIDQGQEAQMGQERVSCRGIITVGLNSPLSHTISSHKLLSSLYCSPRGRRPSPSASASSQDVDTVMKGNDGNNYIVIVSIGEGHTYIRYVTINSQLTCKSSHFCFHQ